ncbi:preprotein translocase subunit YajC [Singulisphaera sp. PoT]|uniref:preprotein translocase subunit YajC n=1 Tax=Singulisphaera sp. PoT TaxID=3411797 RepID=UPI003BF4A239
MPDQFLDFPLIFAQNAPAGNGGAGAGGGGLLNMLPFIAIIVLWGYFLLFRPQQQQEKRRREMLGALKKNDRVVTAAGIYGTVVSIDPDQDKVVLRIDDDRGVKVAFTKAAVVRILDAGSEKTAEPAK